MTVERHPLQPFLPEKARVLFLGSFPPPRNRWCMDFFYPNFINDHWRIEGLVFFGDKNHFVDTGHKTFRLPEIVEFLNKKGIGYFDTATAVRRLKENASDNFLEIVEPTDIAALLRQVPQCRVVVTTGEKATRTLCERMAIPEIPKVGCHTPFPPAKGLPEGLQLYRLPSSSRAYPLPLARKAEAYREMFRFAGILQQNK
ncbi:MAG: uracil-DNA glycosylase family protein [Bacteroidales bacterium]|nr:uracil-DNA glycosylase family protein [Bacteroidales bacterium]